MKKYSHKSTLASFNAAFRGIRLGAKSQKNFRTGLVIGVAVIFAGFLLDFNNIEFALTVIAIGFVLFAELVNTSMEFIVDTYFRTKYSEIAKMSKDIAAGAVLLAIFLSAVIGLLLFVPKILALI